MAIAAGIATVFAMVCRPAIWSQRQLLTARVIAHAFGGLDGKAYLNCAECFESNYRRGYRLFEVDFLETSDGHLVAMHDGNEPRLGLPQPFTRAQFLAARIDKVYTPVDMDRLAAMLREFTDWHLVTDIKTNNPRGLKLLWAAVEKAGLSPADRIIPQIYFKEEARVAKELGYTRLIFTNYRANLKAEAIVSFVRDEAAIVAVTVPIVFAEKNSEALKQAPVPVYAHTVNDAQLFRSLRASGVFGIYTDVLLE